MSIDFLVVKHNSTGIDGRHAAMERSPRHRSKVCGPVKVLGLPRSSNRNAECGGDCSYDCSDCQDTDCSAECADCYIDKL